jgi:hypothetical protein
MARRRSISAPQQPTGVAWDDPLSNGLIQLFLEGTGNYDLVAERPYQVRSSPIQRANGLEFSTSAAGLYKPASPADKSNEYTIIVMVRSLGAGAPYASFAGLSYAGDNSPPYGDQIGFDGDGSTVRFVYNSAGSVFAMTAGPVTTTGFDVYIARYRSGLQTFAKLNAQSNASTTYSGSPAFTANSSLVLGEIDGNARTANVLIPYLGRWNRFLSDAEVTDAIENRFRLARNPRRRTIARKLDASAAIAKPPGVAAIAAIGIVVASGSAKASPAGNAVSALIGMPVASGSAVAMPAGVAAVAQVGTAIASGGSPGLAVPAGVSAVMAVGTPVASGSAVAMPGGVSALARVGTAIASGGSPGLAAPVGVSATMAVGTPVASGSAVAMPGGVSALAQVGTATASGGSPGIASPSGVSATASVGVVSARGGAKAVVAGVAAVVAVGIPTARGSAVAAPAGVAATAAVGNASARSVDAAVAPPVDRVVSDADFQAWCEDDDAIVNIIFEVRPLIGGVSTLLRWSTLGYTTPWIVDPVFYEPGFSLDVTPTEAISLKGGASIAAGNLEIENLDRSREYLKQYEWTNRPFVALVGDWRWGPADYRTIMVGQTAKLTPKDERTLALHLRDSTERLNAPLTEHKLGGDGPNQDALYPLAFGECSNVTGLVTDLLTRSFHDGPMEAIKVVRSNALAVEFTANETVGTCELTVDNQGAAITASIQGDKFGGVYRNTIAALIQRIVTGYGKEGDRFTDEDIDLANFAAFEAAHQQKVGLWVPERMNVLDACDALASSVDARLCPSIDGKLRLIQIAIPAPGPSITILPHHIVGPLRFVEHIDAVAAVKLGFAKSWTVQTGLQTDISGEVRQLFETEWLTDTEVYRDRQALLKLEGDPAQRNTMLLRRFDAHAEVLRLLALWGPGRDIYEFTGLPALMQIRVGQGGNIFNEDFGMEDGKQLQVLSVARAWQTRRVTVRILV